MRKFIFTDAMNNDIEITHPDLLKDLVINKGDDFWEWATGSCGLHLMDENLSDGAAKTTLTLISREIFGFMLNYLGEDTERTLSLRYGEHTGETVTAEIGGNPDSYFKEYCLPKEVAWEVIEYFLKTGERHPKYIWEIAEMPEE